MMPIRSDDAIEIRPLRKAEAAWYASSLDAEILRWSREEPIDDPNGWWMTTGKDRLAIECCGDLVGAAKRTADAKRIEISYWVAAAHRGKGYATSALTLLTSGSRANDPGIPIELEIHPQNDASIRVARRAGFVFAELRQSCDTCADTDGNVAIYRYAG